VPHRTQGSLSRPTRQTRISAEHRPSTEVSLNHRPAESRWVRTSAAIPTVVVPPKGTTQESAIHGEKHDQDDHRRDRDAGRFHLHLIMT
jgi:hypothetical protein